MAGGSTTVRVQGAAKLRRELSTMAGAVEDLTAAHAAVAQLVAQAAAARAPRRSGRLAGAVKGNRAKARATISAPRVPYGPPIHWGWPARGIEGQPFMQRAAVATEPIWLPMYEREIAKAVGKVRGAA